jgi:hypothetical protein
MNGCAAAAAAESVTMAPDGRFIMLDRYGAVKEAREQGGQLVLAPQPIAHLGPGRPLGAQFDAHGNLIICDAFKVRAAGRCCDSRSNVHNAEFCMAVCMAQQCRSLKRARCGWQG